MALLSGLSSRVSLYGNNVGDAGAKAIADATGASGSLAELWLNNSNIWYEGAKALAASVAASGSLALKELYVDYSRLQDAELKAACESKGVKLA